MCLCLVFFHILCRNTQTLIFNQALSLKKRNLGTSTYAWITDWVTHCETTAHVTTTLAATLATICLAAACVVTTLTPA